MTPKSPINNATPITDPLEIWGESTETKPTDVPNMTRFVEGDTGDIYLLLAAGWTKIIEAAFPALA